MTHLTNDDLAAIKARCAAATAGPWSTLTRDSGWKPGDGPPTGGLYFDVDGPPEPYHRGQFERWEDAEFIAHARTDLPNTVAAYESLQVQLWALEKQLQFKAAVAEQWRKIARNLVGEPAE